MNESKAGPVPPVMLLDWEGPAQLNPAVFADEKTLEGYLGNPGQIDNAATWIAVTVGAVLLGNGAPDGATAKALGFLSAWRQRHGTDKLNELKDTVVATIRANKGGKELDVEFFARLNQLFQQAN